MERFLLTHARVRRSPRPEAAVAATVDFANQLTGEPILTDGAMTELSGGQTRALLIADAMQGGAMRAILRTTAEERLVARRLMAVDAMLLGLREKIRGGGRVGAADLDLTEAAVSGGRA